MRSQRNYYTGWQAFIRQSLKDKIHSSERFSHLIQEIDDEYLIIIKKFDTKEYMYFFDACLI